MLSKKTEKQTLMLYSRVLVDPLNREGQAIILFSYRNLTRKAQRKGLHKKRSHSTTEGSEKEKEEDPESINYWTS